MNIFLWSVLPYIAFTIFILGTLFRYAVYQNVWTTKSSQFLEKHQLRIAGPLFHFGLLMTIGGHIGGILIPATITDSLGITEKMYHIGALLGGMLAGGTLLLAFTILCYRRFNNVYLNVNTSIMDKWLYLFLAIAILTGCLATISNIGSDFNYRSSISPWFRSLLIGQPCWLLMENVPLLFQLHMISWLTLIIIFPFTRLVHFLSFPFRFLWRGNIILYRRHKPE